MQSPRRPSGDPERPVAFTPHHALEPADTPVLHELAALAARCCDCAIATVSFIDASRELFVACVGLSVSQLPCDASFAWHALSDADLFVVSDAMADDRFRHSPLVTAPPHVRFYAGAPLVTDDGDVLGALSVMDDHRRALTAEQQHMLGVLSRQVCAQLERRRLARAIAERDMRLQRAINRQTEAEHRFQQISRVYAVMSDVNQMILRERDPQAMLAAACRIAVSTGRYRAAWIGLADRASRLEIRAHAGIDRDTLAIIQELIEADPPAGCVFTEHTLRTGTPSACNDIEHDPGAASWRQIALDRGYRAMVSFPLTTKAGVIGTANMYAAEAHAFDQEEVTLFARLAADISFALDSHAREQEHQRLEAERHLAEQRFRQVVDNIQQAFWLADPSTRQRVTFVSPAYEAIWGRASATADETTTAWEESIHADDRAAIVAALQRALSGAPYDETYRIVRPDGTVRWIRDRAFPIVDPAGDVPHIVGTATDVTEQRQLEDEFRQAQKMESIGRLAGGIAHDFNNLLTVINGTTELALSNLLPGDPLEHDLDQIRQAGDRAATLTRQLLALSRKQILSPAVINLSTVIGNMRSMLRRLIGEDVALTFVLADDLDSVKADQGQIEQVILNLSVNARDAMPSGGVLRIETQNVDAAALDAMRHLVSRPGPHVMVSVTDTGIGMDEAVRQRIFEPFFTTKEVGKGTGLGLSTVYGIVKQSDGIVTVSSEPGRGSTFKVLLPRVDGAVRQLPSRRSAGVTYGAETILLVEDERGVRQLAKRILESAGYSVLTAADGNEALSLLRGYTGQVHAIVTDVVMPGMGGPELAARLDELRPGIKVVFTSGYTDDAVLRVRGLDDVREFVRKPYTPDELRRSVREALDSPES